MSHSPRRIDTILTINTGSSSLKATLFSKGSRRDFRFANIGTKGFENHEKAIEQLLIALAGVKIDAIGHRMTHGGMIDDPVRYLSPSELQRLRALIDLAPLHMPHNLAGVELCARLNAPQFGCYDTSFHASMPALSRRLPLPHHLKVVRCGFHGLNYAHIAEQLPSLLGSRAADGRIAVAHLGNGSSLCLLKERRSFYTTMGWTPLGGVVMGTRSGDLDPGVLLYLLKNQSEGDLERLLWHESGLLALSGGISSQMKTLIADTSEPAHFAIDYYCRRIAQEIGGMAALAGGLDALIFTGGIGENAPLIRKRICENLGFLGFFLADDGLTKGAGALHRDMSAPILLIPADEEGYMKGLIENMSKSFAA